MLSIGSGNSIHSRQLAHSIGGEEDTWEFSYASISIRGVCSIEFIAAAQPLQFGHSIDMIKNRNCDMELVLDT